MSIWGALHRRAVFRNVDPADPRVHRCRVLAPDYHPAPRPDRIRRRPHHDLRLPRLYLLHVRRDILDEIDGPMLRHGLQALHGGKMTVPRSAGKKPNREYLAERFEGFRAT